MFAFALHMLRRLFALLRRAVPGASRAPVAEVARVPGGTLIFRLRAWPELPEHGRTADIYRILSVMSHQPVTRQWLLANSRMDLQQLDALLQQLVAEGAVEVIDPARFARSEPLQAARA